MIKLHSLLFFVLLAPTILNHGCAFQTENNPDPAIDPRKVDGDDSFSVDEGKCVDESISSSLQCDIDRDVTPLGCPSGQVHCAFLCFDAKRGSAVCPEGKVPTAADCEPGMLRCKSSNCRRENETALQCPEGQELSSK